MLWLFPLRMLSFSLQVGSIRGFRANLFGSEKKKIQNWRTDAAGQRTFRIFHHHSAISELVCCGSLWRQNVHVTFSYDVARKLFPLGHFFAAQKLVNCSRDCSFISKSNFQNDISEMLLGCRYTPTKCAKTLTQAAQVNVLAYRHVCRWWKPNSQRTTAFTW